MKEDVNLQEMLCITELIDLCGIKGQSCNFVILHHVACSSLFYCRITDLILTLNATKENVMMSAYLSFIIFRLYCTWPYDLLIKK